MAQTSTNQNTEEAIEEQGYERLFGDVELTKQIVDNHVNKGEPNGPQRTIISDRYTEYIE